MGEHEAGQRLFQVAHDPRCSKSGVYWSWNGGPREGRGAEALEKGGQISGGGGAGGGWDSIFENDQSAKVLDIDAALKLFHYSTEITGAEWPELRAITSPCPTLNVIGAVTKGMVKREELKRMRESSRAGIDDVPSVSKRTKAVMVADRAVGGVMYHTVGRVTRFLGRRVLGEIPEEAKTGSFEQSSADSSLEDLDHNQDILDEEISLEDQADLVVVDAEDEALFQDLFDETSDTDATSATGSESSASLST